MHDTTTPSFNTTDLQSIKMLFVESTQGFFMHVVSHVIDFLLLATAPLLQFLELLILTWKETHDVN